VDSYFFWPGWPSPALVSPAFTAAAASALRSARSLVDLTLAESGEPSPALVSPALTALAASALRSARVWLAFAGLGLTSLDGLLGLFLHFGARFVLRECAVRKQGHGSSDKRECGLHLHWQTPGFESRERTLRRKP